MHAWPIEGIFWGPGRAEGGWQLDEEKADQDDLHVGEAITLLLLDVLPDIMFVDS